MPQISVNGETLHYERSGNGAPLLLIHSLGTGIWMWRDQITHWSRRFDVIAFDARGHGRSTHNGVVSVENIAADFLNAMRALKLPPAHVIAISMGGAIASHLYASDPHSIASLVIADSFSRQGEAGSQRVRDLELMLQSKSMADYGRMYAAGTLYQTTSKAVFDELAASVESMEKDVYLQIAGSVFTSDVAELMKKIKVPARIVVGAQDTRTPVALSEEIGRLIPAAELILIDNAAHLSNLDNPEGFHAAIDPFLSELN